MRTRQFRTFLVIVVAALIALAWTLEKAHVQENAATPALTPRGGTRASSKPAREVSGTDLAPARVVPKDAVELDEVVAEGPTREALASSAHSAPGTWEAEYADYTVQQLDDERRALLGQVGRAKHAIGLAKLDRGEGVIMARGAKPDDEDFASAPGTMSAFRSGPDGAGSMLWERVDLLEVDHPELFELHAKMRWVNEEWARRLHESSRSSAGR
jgi:hypothetical protein